MGMNADRLRRDKTPAPTPEPQPVVKAPQPEPQKKTLAQEAIESGEARETAVTIGPGAQGQMEPTTGDEVAAQSDGKEALTGTEGSTNKLGQQSNEHFQNVSMTWLQHTVPLPDVTKMIEKKAEDNVDVMMPLSSMKVAGGYGIHTPLLIDENIVAPEGEDRCSELGNDPWPMTEHAAKQFSGRLGVPQSVVEYHASVNELDILGQTVNNAIDRGAAERENNSRKSSDFLLRGVRVDDGIQARAVLTDRYSAIDTAFLIGTMDNIFKTQGVDARVSHMDWNGDRFSGHILLPDTAVEMAQLIDPEDDSQYAAMISFSNSEIGTGSVEFLAGIYRAICMNGTLWNYKELGEKLKQRHAGGISIGMMTHAIADMIIKAIPLTKEIIGNLHEAKEIEIPDIRAAIASLSKDAGWSRDRATQWAQGYVAEVSARDRFRDSAFALVNGLTRACQSWGVDDRHKAEQTAGDLIAASGSTQKEAWEKRSKRAETVTQNEVEQYVRIAV